ncbi:hypothetical protein A3K64_01995 [Candidatus Micrarchaeota archaeon RBG_16_36_9]|nr:MAG: hypothetical protein A3K64_01995 [Candidatus Micrarchaeota archaeon RBG_16_36_9]
MKRTANLETIIDALRYGKQHKKIKTNLIISLGLSGKIGRPFLDELAKNGLMKETENKEFTTTVKGSNYLQELEDLNKKYGVDSVIKILLESKGKANREYDIRYHPRHA